MGQGMTNRQAKGGEGALSRYLRKFWCVIQPLRCHRFMQRTAAEKLLLEFQEHPQAWTRVDTILEVSQNQPTKYFALQVYCCKWTDQIVFGRKGSSDIPLGGCARRSSKMSSVLSGVPCRWSSARALKTTFQI